VQSPTRNRGSSALRGKRSMRDCRRNSLDQATVEVTN
jgi:hypothetical protein